MRLVIARFFVLLILCGCQTQQIRRPIDPEVLGMLPKMEPTTDEALKLGEDAVAAFVATFGQPLPTQLRLDGPTTGWFTDKGELRQLRAAAKLPRSEFRRRTASKGWREIPIPQEYLKAMHLPPIVPKDYMTCYVGQVSSKPAYLFWSDYAETAMLVLDY
ncbi:MAG: hypothetical protein HZA92_16625 [Verrucomicrobia bacterium]|nr:hypothetical protein [Verrucomicrobiota bacterium]